VGITPPRSCGPVRHPLAADCFPGEPVYTAYPAPPISRRDEEGFSSCLTCPARLLSLTPRRRELVASARLRRALLPSRAKSALGPRNHFSRLPLPSLTLRPGHSLHPSDGSSMGFSTPPPATFGLSRPPRRARHADPRPAGAVAQRTPLARHHEPVAALVLVPVAHRAHLARGRGKPAIQQRLQRIADEGAARAGSDNVSPGRYSSGPRPSTSGAT
jgi:hypothetical protein